MNKVDYRSSHEEKQEAIRAAIARTRDEIDQLDPFDFPVYTRNVAGFIYCEHCRARGWVRDLTCKNFENGKSVIIRAWWHSETKMQFEFRIWNQESGDWKVEPVEGDVVSQLIVLMGD